MEQAIYHSENARWYRTGEEPYRVKNAVKGEVIMPDFSVVADTYADAFQALYGQAMPIPPIAHFVRRTQEAN